MTAINLDLDKKFHFDFKRKVKIGGKTYDVTFNDDLGKAIADAQIEVANFYKKMNESGFDEMTVQQQKGELHDRFDELVAKVESSLDSLLGQKGAGKSIYDYYDHQLYALLKTFEVLRQTNDSLNGVREQEERDAKEARRQAYLPQRGNRRAGANTRTKK